MLTKAKTALKRRLALSVAKHMEQKQRNVPKPTDKEGDCLILNFYIMNNEQEMLELFKVEELEKRYEMGKWSISGSVSYSSGGGSVIVSGSRDL